MNLISGAVALLVVLGLIAAAYWIGRKEEPLAPAEQDIANQEARIKTLSLDADANAAEIAHLRADLEQKKEALHATYVAQGLSADEIVRRFKRLR